MKRSVSSSCRRGLLPQPLPTALLLLALGPAPRLPAEGAQVRPQWVAVHDEPGSAVDVFQAMALDRQGYVAVLLTSDSGLVLHAMVHPESINSDFLTVLHDPEGQEIWSARYDGPGRSVDLARALVVDGEGNFLVAGASVGETSIYYESVVLKYSPEGQLLWEARYDGHESDTGGGSLDDEPVALAAGPGGTVHTAVMSRHEEGWISLAVVQHDSAGGERWVAREDDLSEPSVAGLAVDAGGNVYLAGGAMMLEEGGWLTRHALVLKYDAAGMLLWSRSYPGPRMKAGGARALALDGEGNSVLLAEEPDSGTSYALIKHGPDGQVLWRAVHRVPPAAPLPLSLEAAPAALALDGEGNVHVTGTAPGPDGSLDFLTVKHDAGGRLLWGALFAGGEGNEDLSRSLAVDGTGAVLVAGSSGRKGPGHDFLLVKYDRTGAELWSARHDGPASGDDLAGGVLVDGGGNAYLAGTSPGRTTREDLSLLRYSPRGERRWERRLDGPGQGHDTPSALAVDAQGNVLLAGGSFVHGTWQSRFLTLKLDPRGEVIWSDLHGEPEGCARDLALDAAGNVVVTGWMGGDCATLKYARDGTLLWSASYGGPDGGHDGAGEVEVDARGSVVVTGTSWGASSREDLVTLKYDAQGRLLWAARHDGPDHRSDRPSALALDREGNVHVAGLSMEASGSGERPLVVALKYGPGGEEVWSARYGGLGRLDGAPPAMALDEHGNLHLVFPHRGAYRVLKYGPEGSLVREAGFTAPLPPLEDPLELRLHPASLALDALGNLYFTGAWPDSRATNDFLIVKTGPGGEVLWWRTHGRAGKEDRATALAVDSRGTVHVTGASEGEETGFDYATLKLDAAGEPLWSARHDRGFHDFPHLAALDGLGALVVSGQMGTSRTGMAIGTIRYTSARPFLRGDCNSDGLASGGVEDAVFLLRYNFLGGERPLCPDACDANGDGEVLGRIDDAVYLLLYGFLGGPPPPEPYPACGEDVLSPLGCPESPACPP